jgi:3-dehydroquinate synthase
MLLTGHVPDANYPIWIESGSLGHVIEIIPEFGECSRVAVITDREISALHLGKLKEQFDAVQIPFHSVIVDGNEAGKNLDSARDVFDFLNDLAWTTQDRLIAFGGGSIQDIAGFAASSYMGGIPYWQIPTSLLAMVDSSVSQDCHLNFRSSKNMISLPSCPSGVLIDPQLLSSLPPNQLANGFARIIQYGYLQSPELIDLLESKSYELTDLIERSIRCKSELLKMDQLFLTFGQPLSDTIQGHFRFLKYLHGESIALGMLAASPGERLFNLLKQYNLPVFIEGVASDTLMKKAAKTCCLQGEHFRFVRVPEPGQIEIETINTADCEKFLADMINSITVLQR